MTQENYITFIGCYNSGKSTLVNALIGKDQFDVGEVQTTREPNEHIYDKFDVIDLPGLDSEDITIDTLKFTLVDLPGSDTSDFNIETFRDYIEKSVAIFYVVVKDKLESNDNHTMIKQVIDMRMTNFRDDIFLVLNKEDEIENMNIIMDKLNKLAKQYEIKGENIVTLSSKLGLICKLAIKNKTDKSHLKFINKYLIEKGMDCIGELTGDQAHTLFEFSNLKLLHNKLTQLSDLDNLIKNYVRYHQLSKHKSFPIKQFNNFAKKFNTHNIKRTGDICYHTATSLGIISILPNKITQHIRYKWNIDQVTEEQIINSTSNLLSIDKYNSYIKYYQEVYEYYKKLKNESLYSDKLYMYLDKTLSYRLFNINNEIMIVYEGDFNINFMPKFENYKIHKTVINDIALNCMPTNFEHDLNDLEQDILQQILQLSKQEFDFSEQTKDELCKNIDEHTIKDAFKKIRDGSGSDQDHKIVSNVINYNINKDNI
jgi:GTPase SAR1 family protein